MSFKSTFTLISSLVIFLGISTYYVHADDVSLSDAVYADLALRHQLDNVSIYYFDGNPSNNIQINDNRSWIPASTVKLFVAMYAFNQTASGKLGLGDYITIKGQNVVPTEMSTDQFPTLQEGQQVTLLRLISQMITQSDNTAYNTLLDVLDRREVTKYIHDLGLANSSVSSKLNLDDQQVVSEYTTPGFGDNVISANDFATAFILIKGGRIPGSIPLENILKQQKINNMIPRDLPSSVIVAHKTGDLAPLYHDGGIVIDADRSYVLSIFSNAGSPDVVAHLSKLIYSKDSSLVGQVINNSNHSEVLNQPLDPLVLNTTPNQQVLGESTKSIPVPELTAADLGVTNQDLSVTLIKKTLPRVIIPADSSLHPLVTAWVGLAEKLAVLPNVKAGIQMEGLKLDLAETVDLQSRGKKVQANVLLNTINQKLSQVVTDPGVVNNVSLQTTAKSISETRFQIMGDSLKTASSTDRAQIIKTIASHAKDEINKVQPEVPKAITASTPSQKPVVGQVVSQTSEGLVVKTNSGQTVTVSAPSDVNIRSHDQTSSSKQNLNSVAVGTTVALMGSNQGSSFVPTFVMTNLPRQLVAPVPSVVLKVNTKNKTMVVNQDGKPTQINLNSQTSIRGSDTNIQLDQVNVGDVVVVRGTATPSGIASPSGTAATSVIPTTTISATSPPESTQKPTTKPGISPTPSPAQPQIIVGKLIQVIEKHQDTLKPKSTSKQTQPIPTSKPSSLPVSTQPPSSPEPTSKSSTKPSPAK